MKEPVLIMTPAAALLSERRQSRELKKHLRDLTEVVTQCLAAYDAEMAKPSSPERGSRIAKISNALNMQNDIAKRFGLGNAPRSRQPQVDVADFVSKLT